MTVMRDLCNSSMNDNNVSKTFFSRKYREIQDCNIFTDLNLVLYFQFYFIWSLRVLSYINTEEVAHTFTCFILYLQWGGSPYIYVFYRICCAIYFHYWIISNGINIGTSATKTPEQKAKWFIQLTNWTSFVLNTNLLLQVFVCLYRCRSVDKERKDGKISDSYL